MNKMRAKEGWVEGPWWKCRGLVRMKSGWSTLHTYHLRCLGDKAVELLTMLILESERMLEEWRSVMVTIFKNKVMCRAVVMTEG